MSKREDQLPLDTLPNPPSPLALDDKILAYARQQAPQRQPLWRSGWVSGLATASVIAIAVLIADPSQQMPNFKDTAEEQEFKSDDYFVVSGLREEGLAAPSPEASRKRSAPATKPKLKAKPKSVALNSAASKQQSSMHAAAMMEERIAGDIAESALLADADFMPMKAGLVAKPIEHPDAALPTLAARQQTRQLALADTSALHKERATAIPPIQLGDAAFVAQLSECEELLKSGKTAEANTLYQQLQKSCVDCELPQSLVEALAQQQARRETTVTTPKTTAPH